MIELKPGESYAVESVRQGSTEKGEWQLCHLRNKTTYTTVFINPVIHGLKDGNIIQLKQINKMTVKKEKVEGKWVQSSSSEWSAEKVAESKEEYEGYYGDHLPF